MSWLDETHFHGTLLILSSVVHIGYDSTNMRIVALRVPRIIKILMQETVQVISWMYNRDILPRSYIYTII